MQYGETFAVNDVVQLEQGINVQPGSSSSFDQSLLLSDVWYRIIKFEKEQSAAEDESTSLARQTYCCCLQPLHSKKGQLKLPLGGQVDLRLKSSRNKEVTAAKITNAQPVRLEWQQPASKVPSTSTQHKICMFLHPAHC